MKISVEAYAQTGGPWVPAILTTDPPHSNMGVPVVLVDGEPRRPEDLMAIRPTVADEDLETLAPILDAAASLGYLVLGWKVGKHRMDRRQAMLAGVACLVAPVVPRGSAPEQPQAKPERFRVGTIQWWSDKWHLHTAACDRTLSRRLEISAETSSRTVEELLAAIDRYQAGETYPAPVHPLDLPERIYTGDYDWCEVEFLTREAALREVAEHNRPRLADGSKKALEDWAFAYEVGEMVPGESFIGLTFEGDVGYEMPMPHYPVRLVRPTAAEIRRYC